MLPKGRKNIITNKELAKKVHDVGSISSPAEIKAILEVLATVIQTEAAENNRIQLESGDGGALVSVAYVTIQQIAEALGMTVDIIDPGLQDLAPLKKLTV